MFANVSMWAYFINKGIILITFLAKNYRYGYIILNNELFKIMQMILIFLLTVEIKS
jgi:hypothetical protein